MREEIKVQGWEQGRSLTIKTIYVHLKKKETKHFKM